MVNCLFAISFKPFQALSLSTLEFQATSLVLFLSLRNFFFWEFEVLFEIRKKSRCWFNRFILHAKWGQVTLFWRFKDWSHLNISMLPPEISVAMGTILSRIIRKVVYMMKCGVPDRHELYIDTFWLKLLLEFLFNVSIFFEDLSLIDYCMLHTWLDKFLEKCLRFIMSH